MRQIIANEIRAQEPAERRAARFEDVLLCAQQSHSTASSLLWSQQKHRRFRSTNLQRNVVNNRIFVFWNREQSYHQLRMPLPNTSANAAFYIEFRCEQKYSAGDLFSYMESNILMLTLRQRDIYDQMIHLSIIKTGIDSDNNSIQNGHYSLTFESSGILTTLLLQGRTAHCTLKLLFNIQYSMILSRVTFLKHST